MLEGFFYDPSEKTWVKVVKFGELDWYITPYDKIGGKSTGRAVLLTAMRYARLHLTDRQDMPLSLT